MTKEAVFLLEGIITKENFSLTASNADTQEKT